MTFLLIIACILLGLLVIVGLLAGLAGTPDDHEYEDHER